MILINDDGEPGLIPNIKVISVYCSCYEVLLVTKDDTFICGSTAYTLGKPRHEDFKIPTRIPNFTHKDTLKYRFGKTKSARNNLN